MTYKIEFVDTVSSNTVVIETEDSMKDGDFTITIDEDSEYSKYAVINISVIRQIESLLSMREQQA